MGVKSYKELAVWQQSMDFVVEVYRLIDRLPKEELFALGSQLRRAVVSIPSNIAEGFGRDSHKDFARFLLMSRGSLFEIGTQLEVASRLGYVKVDNSLYLKMDALSKMLGALIRRMRADVDQTTQLPTPTITKH